MRIGIDCRIFSSKFTGIGRYAFELVSHFEKLNNKLKNPHQFVLFFNNPEYRSFKTPKNFKKVLVNAKHYSLAEQTKFPRLLYKEKLDIVHFPHFNVPIVYRKKYIVTIHDLTLSLFPGQKMNKWYHRLAYNITIKNAVKTAKRVISVSENTKFDITSYLKIKPEKITVIYNGVGDEFKLLQNPKTPKYIKKPFLLYTGVWRNHKNLPGLLKAFAILRFEKKLNLQLVITGKPDPHYPEVQQAVNNLGLQNDVIFPGMVPEKELIQLYNSALFYVFPSYYEGFGLPPLESMKCGTPVAASNSSCIPEICGKDNAIFFDPANPVDIAEKIYKLYKDADLQAALVQKGLSHAAKFSWKTAAEKTFEIITKS